MADRSPITDGSPDKSARPSSMSGCSSKPTPERITHVTRGGMTHSSLHDRKTPGRVRDALSSL